MILTLVLKNLSGTYFYFNELLVCLPDFPPTVEADLLVASVKVHLPTTPRLTLV